MDEPLIREALSRLSPFGAEGLRRLGLLALLEGGEDPRLFLAAPWLLPPGRLRRAFREPAPTARLLREAGVDPEDPGLLRRKGEAVEAEATLLAALLLAGRGSPGTLGLRLAALWPPLLPALVLLLRALEARLPAKEAAGLLYRLLPLLNPPRPGALRPPSPANPFSLF
ncbi:hypothetical protein HRbin39_00125 [bacterium HR39]|nr:hypothetical protein HRbin39_00125 [bacterium HR39]